MAKVEEKTALTKGGAPWNHGTPKAGTKVEKDLAMAKVWETCKGGKGLHAVNPMDGEWSGQQLG